MAGLERATLSDAERLVLERLVAALRERLGEELRAVWLFGSRARGKAVAELSDIDVLVIVDRAGWSASGPIYEALHEAARAVGLPSLAWTFSLHVRDPTWLRRRRAVGSFFAAEVDRNHIDLVAAA